LRAKGQYGYHSKPPWCKEKKSFDNIDDEPYQHQNSHNCKVLPGNFPQDRDNYHDEEYQQSKDWAYARQPRTAFNHYQNSGTLHQSVWLCEWGLAL